MVTLILVFVFLSPYWIDFKDKPVQRNPYRMEVVVVSDAQGGLIFRVDASAIQAKQDDELRVELLRVIAPISGSVDINKVEAERDKSGRVLSYKVWVHKVR
jgi:hypothetical protein